MNPLSFDYGTQWRYRLLNRTLSTRLAVFPLRSDTPFHLPELLLTVRPSTPAADHVGICDRFFRIRSHVM